MSMHRLAHFHVLPTSPHLRHPIHHSFPLTLVSKDKRIARLSPADATSARCLDTCQAKHRARRLASWIPTQDPRVLSDTVTVNRRS